MRKLDDGTEVPDIIRYMTLEYRDKTLHTHWIPTYGNRSISSLSKEEFISYSKEAFDYFITSIK